MKNTALSLVVLCLLAWPLWAQETPPVKEKKATTTTENKGKDPVEKEKKTSLADKHKLAERNLIYIPYKDFTPILSNRQRGVFLSYHLFQQLLASQYAHTIRPRPQKGPTVPYALSEVSCQGAVEQGLVEVKMSIDLQVFAKNWVKIPLALPGAAMTRFDLATPHYLVPEEKGYSLLVKGPGQWKAKGHFLLPLEKTKTLRQFKFHGPAAAKSRFQLSIPGRDHQIRVSGGLFSQPVEKKDHTQVSLFLGPKGQFQLSWKAKEKPLPPQPSQIEATTVTQSTYSLEGEKHKVQVHYQIYGGGRRQFQVNFPKGYNYNFLGGSHLSTLPMAEEDGKVQTVTVGLNRLVKKSYTFSFQLEKNYVQLPKKVSPPQVSTVGASEQRAYNLLYTEGELEGGVATYQGYAKVRFATVRKWVKNSSPYVFFRPKATSKSNLAYKLSRKKPEVEGHFGILVQIDENKITLRAQIELHIRKAKLLSFPLELPEGFISPRIIGSDASLEKNTTGEKKRNLYEVILNRAQAKRATVEIEVSRQVELGADGKLPLWKAPWIHLPQAIRSRGYLALAARSKYNLETSSLHGVSRDTPAGRDKERIPSPPRGYVVYGRYQILKFPYQLEAQLVRKKPKVLAALHSKFSLKEGLFQVETTVYYEIYDAGITSVQFALPEGVKREDLRIEGDHIQNQRPPKDKRKHWEVAFQKEILGKYKLSVVYERELSSLKVGQLTDLPRWNFHLIGAKRLPSYLALQKEGNVNFYFQERGLKEVDMSQVPAAIRSQNTFKAYQILNRDFHLDIKAMKLQYAPVLNTVIEHYHLDSVVTRDGTVHNQFFLSLRNNGRQFLTLHLPEKYRESSLMVEVMGFPPIRPQKQTDGTVTINLLGGDGAKSSRRNTQQKLLLRGRYIIPQSEATTLGWQGELALSPLHFGDIPVTLHTWSTYLPRGYSYLNFGETYVHGANPQSLLSNLQRAVSGRETSRRQHRGHINRLKKKFPKHRGLFSPIALDGRRHPFYLPGVSTLGKKEPPALEITYLGRKTTYFLLFLIFMGTIGAVAFVVQSTPLGRTPLLAGGGVALLLLSILLSPAYQPFILCSLLALGGMALFWVGVFLLVELPREKGTIVIREGDSNEEKE